MLLSNCPHCNEFTTGMFWCDACGHPRPWTKPCIHGGPCDCVVSSVTPQDPNQTERNLMMTELVHEQYLDVFEGVEYVGDTTESL